MSLTATNTGSPCSTCNVTTGAIVSTLGNPISSITLSADNALSITGNVATTIGGNITLRTNNLSYSGLLSTGANPGSLTINAASNSVTVGLGGTNLNNTANIALTNTGLSNIVTSALTINGGPVTVYSNLNLTTNSQGSGLSSLAIRTDYNGTTNDDTHFQPFIGGSYSFTNGNGSLSIVAGSITIGSITAPALPSL